MNKNDFSRRSFLKTASKLGALMMAPQIVPGSVLGRDGAVAPSERIVLGGIGIGNRGSYVLSCFLPQPDVQFVAVCDVKAHAARRSRRWPTPAIRQSATARCTVTCASCWRAQDIDAVLIATGPNWHATASITGRQSRARMFIARSRARRTSPRAWRCADIFRRTGRVFQAGTQRRSLPNFMFAIDLARFGKLGKLHTLHAHPGGLGTAMSGWLPPQNPNRPKRGRLGYVSRPGRVAAL